MPDTPLRLLIAKLLANGVVPLAGDDQPLAAEAHAISDALLDADDEPARNELSTRLELLVARMEWIGEEHHAVREALLGLLRLIVENIRELVLDDSWLHEQLSAISSTFSGPLSLRTLETIGQQLREVILKQSRLKREQVEQANREIERLQRELDTASQLVSHDPLTGVLNRKGLTEALGREIARVRRKDSLLCIALIDIDNFKKLNDEYGHSTGDEALRHLTHTVTEALRPQDTVARYGGEEFIILLPETSLESANAILVRLQGKLADSVFRASNHERLLITFSAGIALLLAGETPETAIARADKAMYAAKRSGKNRVFLAP